MKNKLAILILAITFINVLEGCYQPKEGCLDIYATNFDATADNNCCCQYPLIQVQFVHMSGQNLFNPSDTLMNDTGQAFKINDFSIYFSNFEFTGTSGNLFSTLDTFHLPAENDTIILRKDLLLARANTSNSTSGKLIQKEDFVKVSFNAGVPNEANSVSFSRIPSSSILSRQPDSLFTENIGYVSFKYSFTNGIGQGNSERVIRIYEDVPLSFDLFIPEKNAFNTCFEMIINHLDIFYNIDIENDTDEMVKAKLIQNFSKGITLKSCQ